MDTIDNPVITKQPNRFWGFSFNKRVSTTNYISMLSTIISLKDL